MELEGLLLGAWDLKLMFYVVGMTFRTFAIALNLLAFCAYVSATPASAPASSTVIGDSSVIIPATNLPPEITLNRNTGRGGGIIVTLRLADGQEIPVALDTGSAVSLIDQALEPKLGPRLGKSSVTMFESPRQTSGIYATPGLYLGNVPLMTAPHIRTYDFKNWKIKGLLGMDCLKHYCLQLDFDAEKMRFLNRDQLDTNDLGRAYPIIFPASGRVFVHHASFTGGESTNLLLDAAYLHGQRWPERELPPTYALVDTGFMGFDGRVEGTNHVTLHLAQSVWDGRTYTNLTIRQGGNAANIIGLKFLARHLVTFDFPGRTLYLKQTSVGPLAPVKRPANGS